MTQLLTFESIHETEAEKVQELPSLTTQVIKEKSVDNIEEVSQNWSEFPKPALMDEWFIMPQTKNAETGQSISCGRK